MEFFLSKTSMDRMSNVDIRLIQLLALAIIRTPLDFMVAPCGGYRTAEMQKKLFDDGMSKCDGYINKSKHQSGRAIDLVPCGSKKAVTDIRYYCVIAGVVLSCAKTLKLKIRWGGNWDQDNDLLDNSFNDYGHFELMPD